MEPLLQKEFDATSAKPDGHLEIVYFGEEANEICYFSDIKHWHWSEDGRMLIVIFNDGRRNEVPAIAVRKLRIKSNSEGYALAQQYLESKNEVEVLEAKLQWKRGQMGRQREAMLRWHGTSSSK